MASLFRDIMTPIWNFDSYDNKELESNRSLQYQILSGNLDMNDKTHMTLKLNPSVMDTFSIISNPIGTTLESMAPPFKFALNMATQGVDKDGFLGKTLGQGQAVSFLGDGGYDESVVGLIPVVGAMYQRLKMGESMKREQVMF